MHKSVATVNESVDSECIILLFESRRTKEMKKKKRIHIVIYLLLIDFVQMLLFLIHDLK